MMRHARRIAPLLLVVACAEPVPTSAPSAALPVTPVAVDASGAPRLVHGPRGAPIRAATAAEAAKQHVARIAPAYGVAADALPELVPAGDIPVRGGTITRLVQVIDGLPVEDELRLLVRDDGDLATASGTVVGTRTPRLPARFAADVADDAGAIARAVGHAYGTPFDRGALARARGTFHQGAAGGVTVELARAKQVWHRAGGTLVPAWVVEAYASRPGSTDGDAFRTVLGADGRVLAHRSLVVDAAFTYRVFADATGEFHPKDGPTADATPHPTGTPNGFYPPYVAPSLVTVEGLNRKGVGAPDPWLAAGATETRGNNVDAYADVNAPSGLTSGDFRATTTAAGIFDRVYDTAAQPLSSQGQQMAGVTSLFYNINWLHDFWYDAGFTEAAGNGQTSNFGRGGEEGDAILAEAQDNANGGSRNNANMSTPSDGMPPRMQVFLWSGSDERSMQVGNRTPAVNAAAFGPRSFDVTAQVAIAADGTGVATDACSALTNNVTGRIVLVDRGSCSFKSKALRVQQAGGVAMILADNVANTNPPSMGGDNTITETITIGSLSVTMAEGGQIKQLVAGGATSATLHRLAGVELDGSLDATLIAHEFGHYLHHRLQSCGTPMCGAISEGWGDFLALMITARAGDDLTGAYPFSVYTTQSFSRDPAYFGIRRAPYSVDTAINGLSFRHMADGEPLPANHPILDFNNNAEVHNAGEVWAAAMWEGYVALQQAGSDFAAVRQKMAEYVVAGLLLAPPDGTPTETRDAILAAAQASSQADHDVLVAAFARRGMGSCAVSPPRTSVDFAGIVESSVVKGRALPGEAAIADSVQSCDDDGVLDGGETARLKVAVRNPGHAAVSNVTVTVTSSTPGITVVSPPVAIGTLAPYTSTDVEIDVALEAGATGAIAGELALDVTATDSCLETVSTPIKIALNVDERAASSATDSVDATTTLWTPITDSEVGWTRRQDTALDAHWHGADIASRADTALISPAVTADAVAPLVVSFSHRYSFELSDGTAFDGGVLEISTDGGGTWRDVTEVGVVPAYGQVLTTDSGNPLGGRPAFTGDSPGYPAFSNVTLDFGTQFASQQLQLRFRIGTDQAAGGEGWEIDDIAFAGIVGTPFATLVPDEGTCPGEPTPGDEEDGGGCCDAGPMRASNGVLTLGLAALLLRRRRRRSS